MTLNLIINTAVEPFGFSLEKDGRCLVSIKQAGDRHFSESMISMIDQYCRLYAKGLCDIDSIGVVNGPGSYTGIRIGVSYAKTLAYSLNCSVVGLSSLESLAVQSITQTSVFAVILSAKPQHVYFQLFNCINTINPVSDLVLLHIDDCFNLLESFKSRLDCFVCSKLSLFDMCSFDYLQFHPVDIDCSRLFVLLNKTLQDVTDPSVKNLSLNYICQPKIGA
tara:strand:- start:3237 stop:3899 length:663 start_codon:yes stop_codon:yes gene_type:complete